MIVFPCENCGRSITVMDDEVGEFRRCEGCGTELRIPSVSQDLPATTLPEMPAHNDVPATRAPAGRHGRDRTVTVLLCAAVCVLAVVAVVISILYFGRS